MRLIEYDLTSYLGLNIDRVGPLALVILMT